MTTCTTREIISQPQIWRTAARHGAQTAAALGRPGQRVLVIGCGTSAFVAHSIATLRESSGLGETDWAYASEMPPARRYDRVVALSRSGTTTEVLDAIRTLEGTTEVAAVCGVAPSPLAQAAHEVVLFDFADEESVVQTRFPTSVLVAVRAGLGHDVSGLADRCEQVLSTPLPYDVAAFDHFVFLGRGWTRGLADEAALKVREAAQAWSESHPAMDYRHGPIAVAGERTLVSFFGHAPDALVDEITAVGATVISDDLDPLVQLVRAQRLAVDLAGVRGLDPDAPRHLTRSVILH